MTKRIVAKHWHVASLLATWTSHHVDFIQFSSSLDTKGRHGGLGKGGPGHYVLGPPSWELQTDDGAYSRSAVTEIPWEVSRALFGHVLAAHWVLCCLFLLCCEVCVEGS